MTQNILTPYWKWDNGLSADLLNLIHKDIESLAFVQGGMDKGVDLNYRDTSVAKLDSLHWLTGIMFNFANYANNITGWNRKLTGPELTQIAIYEAGQHYDWHADTNPLGADPFHRKVTAVALLNDPSEFEGGNLEIENWTAPIDLVKGTVITFPSVLRHRVTPVTNGKRITAACWILGPTSW